MDKKKTDYIKFEVNDPHKKARSIIFNIKHIQIIEEKHHYDSNGKLTKSIEMKISGRKTKGIPSKSIQKISYCDGDLITIIKKEFDYLFI